MGDWLAYIVVRIFICIVQALPLSTCQVFCEVLAYLAADLFRIRGPIVDENLKGAFPHWSDDERRLVTRKMWEHLMMMVCEVAQTPRKIHETNWRHFVTISDKRTIVGYLLERRPAVVVSGHFGNFELGGYVCALLGFPTFTIARRLDNPYLHAYINRFRQRTGQYILPKDGSSRQIQAVLDANSPLMLLGDQHAGPKGCWVDFMGRPASCHKALAVFSIGSGGPLMVVAVRRDGAPMHFTVELAGVADPRVPSEDTASIKTLTGWYNRMLESIIRKSPEQYWWLHRRWRDPPVRSKPMAERQHATKAAA